MIPCVESYFISHDIKYYIRRNKICYTDGTNRFKISYDRAVRNFLSTLLFDIYNFVQGQQANFALSVITK